LKDLRFARSRRTEKSRRSKLRKWELKLSPIKSRSATSTGLRSNNSVKRRLTK